MTEDELEALKRYTRLRNAGAILSPCRVYRYALWREWPGGTGYVLWIMFNPSSADEVKPDPTIRRCIGFATRWGCQALIVVNLFAYRATHPADLFMARDPIGPDNDEHLRRETNNAQYIVCAWGASPKAVERSREVLEILRDKTLHVLGLTNRGHPRHPLYVAGATQPALLSPK